MVDVDDCTNAARHLAAEGHADAERLCISGGSAGGYTTLACLAFRCAAATTPFMPIVHLRGYNMWVNA